MTAIRAPRLFSDWSQIRPESSGICRMGKYSGLTKLSRARCSCSCDPPRTSKRLSAPLLGGVALVEIPAEATCGIEPTFFTSWSKYAERFSQVVYVLSCTGMPTDMTLCGLYPRLP